MLIGQGKKRICWLQRMAASDVSCLACLFPVSMFSLRFLTRFDFLSGGQPRCWWYISGVLYWCFCRRVHTHTPLVWYLSNTLEALMFFVVCKVVDFPSDYCIIADYVLTYNTSWQSIIITQTTQETHTHKQNRVTMKSWSTSILRTCLFPSSRQSAINFPCR